MVKHANPPLKATPCSAASRYDVFMNHVIRYKLASSGFGISEWIERQNRTESPELEFDFQIYSHVIKSLRARARALTELMS